MTVTKIEASGSILKMVEIERQEKNAAVIECYEEKKKRLAAESRTAELTARVAELQSQIITLQNDEGKEMDEMRGMHQTSTDAIIAAIKAQPQPEGVDMAVIAEIVNNAIKSIPRPFINIEKPAPVVQQPKNRKYAVRITGRDMNGDAKDFQITTGE